MHTQRCCTEVWDRRCRGPRMEALVAVCCLVWADLRKVLRIERDWRRRPLLMLSSRKSISAR